MKNSELLQVARSAPEDSEVLVQIAGPNDPMQTILAAAWTANPPRLLLMPGPVPESASSRDVPESIKVLTSRDRHPLPEVFRALCQGRPAADQRFLNGLALQFQRKEILLDEIGDPVRTIESHKVNDVNNAIDVLVLDEAGPGGASHVYEVSIATPTGRTGVVLRFQKGPIKEVGVNGITQEALLAVVIDRLEGFQSGPFACKDNEDALAMIKGGLTCLLKRTRLRQTLGIEGTNVPHPEQTEETPIKADPGSEPPILPTT